MSLRFHLRNDWLSAKRKLKYYFGLSLATGGSLIALWGFFVLFGKSGTWLQPVKLIALSRVTTGTLVMGIGGYFEYPEYQYRQRRLRRNFSDIGNDIDDYTIDDGNPTISTGGGNYNEFIGRDYIQGDYIAIQGDYININSDISDIVDELREIVTHLENEGRSREEAQQLVIHDLENQARNNPIVEETLRYWGHFISNIGDESSLSETATAVVQAATETALTVTSTEVIQGTPTFNANFYNLVSTEPIEYQHLKDFLKSGQWQKADAATASLILSPLLKEIDNNLNLIPTYIKRYIEVFPGEDLRFINGLWLEHSEGRFGFSVQQNILNEVDGDYRAFGERVGWYVEGNWIFYADISYSLKAPPGHLPILVLSAPMFYHSQRCYFARRALRLFALRQYKGY